MIAYLVCGFKWKKLFYIVSLRKNHEFKFHESINEV